MDFSDEAQGSGIKMASASDPAKGKETSLSPWSERVRVEEAMGKLGLSEEEATPLVINDLEESTKKKWALAGKVLSRSTFHI